MRDLETDWNMKISNIPIINLKNEFIENYRLLKTNEFKAEARGQGGPYKAACLVWHGMLQGFLTLLLQRAILGIESYVGAAVDYEARRRRLSSARFEAAVKNPFSQKGRGTADNLFNLLPAILNEDNALKVSNEELWKMTDSFYRCVRNPLFHGNQLSNQDLSPVLKAFGLIEELFRWVDSWYTAFPVPGSEK